MDELMLNGYFYDVNDNYRKIVGRTDNVNTMRNSLYRLANRYTDDDIFTIPVSLNRYVESNNVKSLVKRAARKGAELNDVEKKNLNSFCSFIKKILILVTNLYILEQVQKHYKFMDEGSDFMK